MDTFLTAFDNVTGAIVGFLWHDNICWVVLAIGLDTMYLAVLNLFYIDRSANLDFASLHLGLGVRPINSPTNVLV